MRILYLLRGAPGAGKSTWIKENQLEPFTLSGDNIRQMICGVAYDTKGNPIISQKYDNLVWNILLERLEERMDRGEFVIVDATHYRAALLQQYKKLINKYRYRPYIIDFTTVPEEIAIERNLKRELYKRVPVTVIQKMYRVFESDRKEVSNRFHVITKEEAIDMLHRPLLYDYNQYKKVYVFGDIHGCYQPLQDFFNEHPMNDEDAYIFTGDYLDRGVQCKEVLEFLLSIKDKQNVLFLEGNHERWLRMYAEGETKELTKEEIAMLKPYVDKAYWIKYNYSQIRNRGFKAKTIPQIEGINKTDIRQFCRRLGQMAYISFGEKNYYISHGGTAMLPSIFVPTETYIEGTGKYEDVDTVYQAWETHRNDNDILVHAHRNIFNYDACINDHCYNLCDDIEYGEYLRILVIDKNGEHVLKYKNNIFDEELVQKHNEKKAINFALTGNELIDQLNNTSLVQKKQLDDGIVSYNFTRNAFNDKRWNQLTVTARGLFIKDNKVVARSYDKFFNWGENDTVTNRALHDKLVFPVKAYQKENGFLAIVSHFNGKLLPCSKSTTTGEFVGYLKNHLESIGKTAREKMLQYAQEHDVSFVFECIDPIHDSHIVKYNYPHLVLLDVIKNDLTMQKLPYEGKNGLHALAMKIGLEVKNHDFTFNSWQELFDFIKEQDSIFTPWDKFIEGWVFEDANGYMVKYKTPTYRWWKQNRGIMEKAQHNHEIKPIYICSEDVIFFGLLDKLKKENKLEFMKIVDIEEEFRRLPH